jgi:hypothetical protein
MRPSHSHVAMPRGSSAVAAPHLSPGHAWFARLPRSSVVSVCFDRVAVPLGSGITLVVELLTALRLVESAQLWKRLRAKGNQGPARKGRINGV